MHIRALLLGLLLLSAGPAREAWAKPPAQPAAPHWSAQVGGSQVDVTPTMQRIATGGSNPHRNDGTTFQNRERRLPQGHTYTEYVVPTPGQRGPGPKRIVVDEAGKAYYTPDHYDHFYPVTRR